MNNCRKLEIGSKHSCYNGKVAEPACVRNKNRKGPSKRFNAKDKVQMLGNNST